MKKFIYFLVFLTVAILIWGSYIYWLGKSSNVLIKKNLPSKNESGNNFEIQYKDRTYAISWLKTSANDVSLFPNFGEELTSSEALNNNNCDSLVSGGFYSEENKPLGLFVSNYQKISNEEISSLLNGFFYIDDKGSVEVSTLAPQNARLALQTGPVLVLNEDFLKIRTNNDSYARRVVAATTNTNEIIFFVIYQKQNLFLGPLLNDLPTIIEKINNSQNFKLISAINLDGGAHSAFLTENLKLTEISRIGSYFCIKN